MEKRWKSKGYENIYKEEEKKELESRNGWEFHIAFGVWLWLCFWVAYYVENASSAPPQGVESVEAIKNNVEPNSFFFYKPTFTRGWDMF